MFLSNTRRRHLEKISIARDRGRSAVAASGAASAQIYTGPGYSIQIEPRYDRDYEYDRRRYRRDYDGDPRYYRRSGNGCPRGYTVQDGVCKPYRGY